MFHFYHKYKKTMAKLSLLSLSLAVTCTAFSPLSTTAAKQEDVIAAQRALPIESNATENWPEGPVVTAQSAILMEAQTGAILYAKNIHAKQYPASTTKILTTLIASEQCALNEVVTFSHDAVYGIPRGSNHIAMNEGDTLTMEQCLNAILIRSANEVSYAVAEHIGTTWNGFADIMNNRAKELGCVDSNFVNPNGLPDENHYTSAYDLAMIGRAFFDNELLCQITKEPALKLMKSTGEYIDHNKMELLPGKKYAYEYLVGCKTGYTDDARSTLVSCAEKNGMKLICVVLKDESPAHYEDTIALFNYGFSNFNKLNISQTETKYNIDSTGFFYSGNEIFGTAKPILQFNKQDCMILPKTVDFQDTTSAISYENLAETEAARVTYHYKGVFLGSASLNIADKQEKVYSFETIDSIPNDATEEKPKSTFIFINIIKVLLVIVGIIIAIFIILVARVFLKNYQLAFIRRRRRNSRRSASNTLADYRKGQIKEAKRRARIRSRRRRR